jgi:hypothetical protein
MPQILSELKLNEVSLVDRPANSTVDPKTGKKTARAIIALFKRDVEKDCKHEGECKCKEAAQKPHKKGVQFVVGFPKGGGGSKVQSVMFDKDLWSVDEARKWLEGYNLKSGKIDHADGTIRFRQEDPGGFERFRVITPGQQKPQKGVRIAEPRAREVRDVEKEVVMMSDKHDYGPNDERLWGAVNGDPEARLNKDGECQTQGGQCFPASDYAYVPDRTKPSTWKLRLTSTPGGKPDSGIVGAAAAALGPGFRGRKVQIPSSARGAVVSRVRAAWRAANPDRGAEDMPGALSKGDNMTLEELELQVTKQDETIAELHKRNASLDAENALVIQMTKRERKLYASMEDAVRKEFMDADVQKRAQMLDIAKRKKRERKLAGSMEEAIKAEYDAAGPIQKAAMLAEQERLMEIEKRRKRYKGDGDSEDRSRDDSSQDDDMDDDEDDGRSSDSEDDKDKRWSKRGRTKKMDYPYPSIEVQKQMAVYEDRIAKSEQELEDIRKQARVEHFAKMAETELPNTPGSPMAKGLRLQKLAEAWGEDSAEFRSELSIQKNQDKILATQFSEIGKASRGDIPSLAVFDAKVEEIVKRDHIDKAHAVAKAMEEAPQLYMDYEREKRQIVSRA